LKSRGSPLGREGTAKKEEESRRSKGEPPKGTVIVIIHVNFRGGTRRRGENSGRVGDE